MEMAVCNDQMDAFTNVCVENNTNIVDSYEVYGLDQFLGDCGDILFFLPLTHQVWDLTD